MSVFEGYAGYIPGVKPENVHAKTYSKATKLSADNAINRGIDVPTSIKYHSSAASEYI